MTAHRFQRGDVRLQISEIGAVRGALIVKFLQRCRDRLQVAFNLERSGFDVVPRQGAVPRAFTDFTGVDERGQRDVRRHAAVLRAFAGDPVIFPDGHVELTELGLAPENRVVERVRILHRAFAVGLLTDDERTAVVLDRTCKNFRRRRAESIHQNDQRTAVVNRRIGVVVHLDSAGGIAQLNHRATIDEQPRQRLGLGKISAAVGAQIHDEHFGAVLAQLADQSLHVAGGAAIVLRAGPARIVILIETRHRDDADFDVAAVARDGAHGFVRSLRLERYPIAGEFNDLLRGARRRARRQQLQAHERAARPAYLLHDVVETPADHVQEFARLAFADRRDAIVGR